MNDRISIERLDHGFVVFDGDFARGPTPIPTAAFSTSLEAIAYLGNWMRRGELVKVPPIGALTTEDSESELSAAEAKLPDEVKPWGGVF